MSDVRQRLGQERVGAPIVNAIDAILQVALGELGTPLDPLREYMQDFLLGGYVAVIDAGTKSDDALERIDPKAVQRTVLLLVRDFLAWYGRAADEPWGDVDARATRIAAGAAERLGIPAPAGEVPLDVRSEAWAVDAVRDLGLGREAASMLAVGHLTQIKEHATAAAARAAAPPVTIWSWKDQSPALVDRAVADFAIVTTLALQAAPRDSEVWMRRRGREISTLIERYFGDLSREGEISSLAERAGARLSSEGSTSPLLNELHRESPKAWREQLFLVFATLVTMSDQALEHPEALDVVAAALDVVVDEVAARPDAPPALAKLRPAAARAPAKSYSPKEVAELLANDAVRVIDVRDAGSFGRHHVPSAVFLEPSLVVERLRGEERPVVLYCRSGDVSQGVAEELAKHRGGVGWLAGGYIAWEVAGNPIERP